MKRFDKGRYYKDPDFRPRMHQAAFIDWVAEDLIIKGKRFCGMYATPGAGKSALPEIVAQLIEIGAIEMIIWVVPRDSLKKQGADSFTKESSWNPSYKAFEADNKAPLIAQSDIKDGRRCLTVTYPGIASDLGVWLDWVKKYSTAILLDEAHHLCDDEGSKWLQAIKPLVDEAAFCLAMTGTVERHDGKPLPFFNYEERIVNGKPKKFVVPDITYTRSQSLEEKAKLPIKFTMTKGWANWIDEEGEHAYDISQCDKEYEGKVVKAILNDEGYIQSVLNESLSHYLDYKKNTCSEAKYIGVFHLQAAAHRWSTWVSKFYPSLKVGIAISDSKGFDTPKGRHAIERFKKPNTDPSSYDVLFTVGMAYEGLDVPSATHLVCLTNTRSYAWLEQCFDRPTRVDYKAIANGLTYEGQQAYIWVPDDPRMRGVVEYIQNEQQIGLSKAKEKPPGGGGGDDPPPPPPPEGGELFMVLSSELDGQYYADTDNFFSLNESELLDKICTQYSVVRHLPPKTILKIYKQGGFPLSIQSDKEKIKPKFRPNQIEYYLEKSDGKTELSKQVKKLCCQCDHLRGQPFGTYARQFGSQNEWGIRELWRLRETVIADIAQMKIGVF